MCIQETGGREVVTLYMHSGVQTGVYKCVTDSKDTPCTSGTACVCHSVPQWQQCRHHNTLSIHTHAVRLGGRALQHAGVSTHVCESVCSVVRVKDTGAQEGV